MNSQTNFSFGESSPDVSRLTRYCFIRNQMKMEMGYVLITSPIGNQPVASCFKLELRYQTIHSLKKVSKKVGIVGGDGTHVG